jgi:hypothetical protein
VKATFDALHLATVSGTKADYFCTCDDNLVEEGKKAEDLRDERCLLELIAELTP